MKPLFYTPFVFTAIVALVVRLTAAIQSKKLATCAATASIASHGRGDSGKIVGKQEGIVSFRFRHLTRTRSESSLSLSYSQLNYDGLIPETGHAVLELVGILGFPESISDTRRVSKFSPVGRAEATENMLKIVTL
jgi:hypothetical protein